MRAAAHGKAAPRAASQHASRHDVASSAGAAPKGRRSVGEKRSRSIAQENSSFVARSGRAAAAVRAQHEDTGSLDDAEVRSRLRELDTAPAIPSLLPPPRTLALYDARGHLIVPAPLRGSREVLLHQNEMADRDGLARVQDDEDLDRLRSAHLLVPLPVDDTLRVDERLPEDRRYSRPWTAAFLAEMAHDFYATFHAPLQVDSAVRTVAVQKHLERTNGNAAPAEGDTASPHLTGQAVDVAKGGLTRAEIAWMRLYLEPLIDAGKIDVEEEFRQACFHISVYKSYMPAIAAHVSVASAAGGQPDVQP